VRRPSCAASHRAWSCWSIGRVLQGFAGALLVPGSLAIITSTFEGPARARAFGLWAAVTAALTTLGPPIGGIFVDSLGWRALFLINVPLVAAALWCSIRYMAESRDESATGDFDWLGASWSCSRSAVSRSG
jgi:MFS family permease